MSPAGTSGLPPRCLKWARSPGGCRTAPRAPPSRPAPRRNRARTEVLTAYDRTPAGPACRTPAVRRPRCAADPVTVTSPSGLVSVSRRTIARSAAPTAPYQESDQTPGCCHRCRLPEPTGARPGPSPPRGRPRCRPSRTATQDRRRPVTATPDCPARRHAPPAHAATSAAAAPRPSPPPSANHRGYLSRATSEVHQQPARTQTRLRRVVVDRASTVRDRADDPAGDSRRDRPTHRTRRVRPGSLSGSASRRAPSPASGPPPRLHPDRLMNRAELLQAVIAERWPRPEEIAREHPEHTAYRRRVLLVAMATRHDQTRRTIVTTTTMPRLPRELTNGGSSVAVRLPSCWLRRPPADVRPAAQREVRLRQGTEVLRPGGRVRPGRRRVLAALRRVGGPPRRPGVHRGRLLAGRRAPLTVRSGPHLPGARTATPTD
ncbi:hypothetical protein GA0074692_0054 [Micromonospora pallida]|uniref:Uncharacterized protein n=1 Tax=Micromonospora pallida TaxID=145854 RepID=A0A1C6RIW1_9ACTN|nr:hypothetical protein GA0074692_0054 [Micromonospora pallida]